MKRSILVVDDDARILGSLSRALGRDWDEVRTALDADEAQDWLTTLNDVRLVLGTRLGITEEIEPAEQPEDEGHAVYDWLTWLQATLVEALLP